MAESGYSQRSCPLGRYALNSKVSIHEAPAALHDMAFTGDCQLSCVLDARSRMCRLSDLQTGSRADFEFVSTANAPRAEKNIFVDKVVSEYP